MGFDQSGRRALYLLRFDEPGHELTGLEVGCRKPGFRATRLLERAVLVLGDDLSGQGLAGDALLAAWSPLFGALQQSVRRWNLMDDGRSVPVSALLDQDIPFLIMLARTWYEQVVKHLPGTGQAVDDSSVDDWEAPSGKTTVDDVDLLDQQEAPESGPGGTLVSPVTGAQGIDEEWLAQLPARELLDPPDPEGTSEEITVPAGPVLAGADAS